MDIKQLMVQYFERPEINKIIRNYADQNSLNIENLDNDQLMDILDQLQILEPLLQQMQNRQNDKGRIERIDQYEQVKWGDRIVKMGITGGRKFDGWKNSPKGDRFVISVAGFGQKFVTKPIPLAPTFQFLDEFTFAVQGNELKTNNCHGIELAVILNPTESSPTQTIYSIKLIEWRYILVHGSINFDIQLAPYVASGETKGVGILSISLQLSPFSKKNSVNSGLIDREIQLEGRNRQKYNNQFYIAANQFWNEYKQIHKSFQSRRVKLYGDSDDKIFIPLPRFITPLYNVRGIDSPHHALRFVSLLPFQQQSLTFQAPHKRFHTFLSSKLGSVDDHCHMLCSLLLGFGLKAYVCIGHSYKGEHSWVISEDVKNGSIIFWQCTRGKRYDYFDSRVYDFYRSIHVVYNDKQFYANVQMDESIAGTKFKFRDTGLWKSFDIGSVERLPLYNTGLCLRAATLDTIKLQKNIENELCSKIAELRSRNKLSFNRDMILASILSTALANYEIQRVTGLTFCQQEFQNAIKNYIPSKHTFKAFPIQLNVYEPDAIMESLRLQPKCMELLLSTGDSLYFGVRAKVVVYPDNVFVVWLSVAVRYFKLT